MKILITGILGFIGSNLAERLVRDGDEVCGLIRRVASRKMDIIAKISEDITLISGDITDNMSTRNAIKTANPDTVIHLAALSPVRDSFERPFEYQQANLVGTMNVLQAISQAGGMKDTARVKSDRVADLIELKALFIIIGAGGRWQGEGSLG